MLKKRSIVVTKTRLKSSTSDVAYWRSQPYAVRLAALETIFGFSSIGLTQEDFLTPDQVIQLGYPPNRIDLVTTPDGVNFETCYQSKIEVEIDEINVDFIDLENLKINKKASGKLQDLADLEKLSE
jgi:hypothetical protein